LEKEALPIHESKKEGGIAALLHRIWTYKLHYIIVIPAILLIVIFKIIPLLTGLYLPFVDYSFFRGLFSSPWVGMDNFTKLFQDPAFLNVFENTWKMKISYLVVCGLTAFILALALSGVRSKFLRNMFSTLFLIPYFLPAVVMAYIMMVVLSPKFSPFISTNIMILGNANFFLPVLIVVEVVKTCGIPIVVALAAIGAKHQAISKDAVQFSFMQMNVLPALRAVAACMLIQFSLLLSTDFELVSSFLNPLVYEVGDTLDTFSYRMGLMNGGFSAASAVWFIQFIVHLVLAVLVYLLIRGIFIQDLFSRFEQTSDIKAGNKGRSAIGLGISTLYSLIILLLLYILFIYPIITPSTLGKSVWDVFSMWSFGGYLLINFAAVIVHLLITLTLAFPLTVRDLPGRNMYKAFLLILLAIGPGVIHEYLFIKNLGMVNTFYPQLFLGFFSLISVFILKSIFNSKHAGLKEAACIEGRGELYAFFYIFVPKVWKPLIALGILQFVALWNSYTYSLLYISSPNLFSPVMLFRTISLGGGKEGIPVGDPIILQFGAIICLPSIILFLLFRKLLTAEVLISPIRKS
jgi:putative aldouronate transport system permease protein